MKTLFSLLLVVTFVSCSGTKSKYQIEKEALVSFSEATYQKWDSPVKGGGAGMNITLMQESTEEDVKIQGIYFLEKYAVLKSQGNGKFQGYIETKANTQEEDSYKGSENQNSKVETVEEQFPFQLEANEAVISFLHKGKLKYNKIKLQKKEQSIQDDVPR